MKADLTSVVELAVDFSGFDAEWWTKTIEDAQWASHLDLDDPSWRAQDSGWLVRLALETGSI